MTSAETTVIPEAARDRFEEKVFSKRFMASIARVNPSGPVSFMPVDCPTKAELCKRDEAGDYTDPAVSAMWFGFKLGYRDAYLSLGAT